MTRLHRANPRAGHIRLARPWCLENNRTCRGCPGRYIAQRLEVQVPQKVKCYLPCGKQSRCACPSRDAGSRTGFPSCRSSKGTNPVLCRQGVHKPGCPLIGAFPGDGSRHGCNCFRLPGGRCRAGANGYSKSRWNQEARRCWRISSIVTCRAGLLRFLCSGRE